jgi:hypothetical protein
MRIVCCVFAIIVTNLLYVVNGNYNSSGDSGILWNTLSTTNTVSYTTMKLRPIFNCINREISCSGHGDCTYMDICKCDKNYFGPNCELASCFSKTALDPTVCSGHGSCVKHDYCDCNSGYAGAACDIHDSTEIGLSIVSPGESCLVIHRSNKTLPSGVYWTGTLSNPFRVFCDMEDTDSNGLAGWTLFQRRDNLDAGVDFWNTWDEYKNGFGNLWGSFWLGNTRLHETTDSQQHSLRVQFLNHDTWYHVDYGQFHIGSEDVSFNLTVGSYSVSPAGDSMTFHNGRPFSTINKNDNTCATEYHGAYWFADCHASNCKF